MVDLKAQYLALKAEIDEAICRVLSRSHFVKSDDVTVFEREFAEFCGAQNAVGVASGANALHLALLACDIKPGDEVITTPVNKVAAVEAICHVGAKAVFIDVDPQTGNIDPDKIKIAITKKTTAIIPAHLHGYPAEMGKIREVAQKHGLRVIEDAGQSHGALYKGRHVGTFGNAGCFSFHPSNNLGAFGEAGIVVTDDPDIAEKVRLLSNHGRKDSEHIHVGFNSRMDSLQAAILQIKLSKLEDWKASRKAIASTYRRLLSSYRVSMPPERIDVEPSYHRFVVRTPMRGHVRRIMNSAGIDSRSELRFPIHLQPAYRYLKYQLGDLPVSELVAQEMISLPIYPELTNDQIYEIARCFNQVTPESSELPARQAAGA